MRRYDPLPRIIDDNWVINIRPPDPHSQPLINPPSPSSIPTLFIGDIDTSESFYRPEVTTEILSAPVKQHFYKTLLSVPVPQFIHKLTHKMADDLEWQEMDSSGNPKKDAVSLEYIPYGDIVGREGDMWYNTYNDKRYVLVKR